MKFEVVMTTKKTFETDLSFYPEGTTEEGALKMEQEAANDDPDLFVECGETEIIVKRVD